jgi:thiazole synthase
MSTVKSVTVNGNARRTTAETVADLARELDPSPQSLLIERNLHALTPSSWTQEPVQEGDTYQVLKISAGG